LSVKIGIAGDWHINENWALWSLEKFSNAGLNTIAHLGDFGFWGGLRGSEYLILVSYSLGLYEQSLFVTPGNHEDYDLISEEFLPIQDGENAGWLAHPEYPGIYVTPRGHRWTWGGRTFVSLGGANSIDRSHRSEGVTWWAAEAITATDVERTISGGFADIFLAHDAPEGVDVFGNGLVPNLVGGWSPSEISYANESRGMLRAAVDVVKPMLYFHGHHHHYLDLTTTLVDGHGATYSLHSIGLDMDDRRENLGVLDLDSLNFSILEPVK
jgi:hypothetical protein